MVGIVTFLNRKLKLNQSIFVGLQVTGAHVATVTEHNMAIRENYNQSGI